ncbi:copper resistance protein CRF1 [Naviculisporaceae sp. PSN 640]
MLINGEKYACEACVRGHRVSNCQHHDRPLQHINKKGRPVSQCQHCRAMRKSRASHVKCGCGEKTHKCKHLVPTVEGHKDSCCCNHGGRCTCSHKKEPLQLDTVPESDSDKDLNSASKSSRARRRANTTSSEGILSFDANGHHKPTHKHNKASQKCGPYQLNRANSMHHTSSAGNHSTDSHCSDSLGSRSPTHSSTSGGVTSQSEATSPLMTGSSSFAHLNGQLPPLDLSAIKFPAYVPNSAEFFGSISDYDPPIFSAGVDNVDWSQYQGLDFGSKTGDLAPSSYSQPQSYGAYDFTGSDQMPNLTTNNSTSGEVSEVEDLLPNSLDDFDAGFPNASAFSLPNLHANVLGSTDLSLDFDEYKMMKASNKFLPATTDEPTLLAGASAGFAGYHLEDEPAYWMPDYHGLPALTDSPAESNLAGYWDGQ